MELLVGYNRILSSNYSNSHKECRLCNTILNKSKINNIPAVLKGRKGSYCSECWRVRGMGISEEKIKLFCEMAKQ